ncbi:putative kinetochore protein spc24 [Rhizina undulata]
MVILEEKPHKLIAEVIGNFNIANDVQSIARTKAKLSHITTTREKSRDECQNLMRSLSRIRDVTKQSCEASMNSSSRKEHGQTMLKLDKEKFSLAKKVNDIDSGMHALEGQLARLREELEAVDSEDAVQQAMEAEDGTVLRLKVYRSLGMDIEGDGAGGYNKVVIRNPAKGDVHVVNIENKFSTFFYANYFWNNR